MRSPVTASQIDALTQQDRDALFEQALVGLTYDSFGREEMLAKLFESPDRDPRFELAARVDGRLVGAAVGTRGTGSDGLEIGHLKLLLVAPDYRRQGIGRALLAALEERCRAAGCQRVTTAGHPPIYLWPGVDTRYTPLICLLQAAGYRKAGEAINLTIDLKSRCFATAHAEADLANENIHIRRLVRSDRERLSAYLEERWGANWHAEALLALRKEPATGFIAERADRIVGFAAYDAARRGWFGPMGTDPDLRGKGVGSVLLLRCLRDWQEQGLAECEVSWIGPLAFYARVAGARIGRICWQLTRAL